MADVPGFRRRLIVTPSPGHTVAALEDDYHCMAVALSHDSETITAVEAIMDRAPWTTCPGAREVLVRTFTGIALTAASKQREKTANCTHLFDLAQLAAAHAGDAEPIVFDIAVTDPIDGRIETVLRRNGAVALAWSLDNGTITAPPDLAGQTLFTLRDWIATCDPATKEAARILQWGSIIAHGRRIPLADQSDATRMPPNCYSFQPERKAVARRVGRIFDFSAGDAAPLDHFDGAVFEPSRRAASGG